LASLPVGMLAEEMCKWNDPSHEDRVYFLKYLCEHHPAKFATIVMNYCIELDILKIEPIGSLVHPQLAKLPIEMLISALDQAKKEDRTRFFNYLNEHAPSMMEEIYLKRKDSYSHITFPPSLIAKLPRDAIDLKSLDGIRIDSKSFTTLFGEQELYFCGDVHTTPLDEKEYKQLICPGKNVSMRNPFVLRSLGKINFVHDDVKWVTAATPSGTYVIPSIEDGKLVSVLTDAFTCGELVSGQSTEYDTHVMKCIMECKANDLDIITLANLSEKNQQLFIKRVLTVTKSIDDFKDCALPGRLFNRFIEKSPLVTKLKKLTNKAEFHDGVQFK
jgi:hypothetical protein